MKITGTASTIADARRLRRSMSLPEVLLWERLRRVAGLRFRRQHPAGPYVLDFFCATAKLAVEVDGIVHQMGDAPAHDAGRDAYLTRQALRVIRVPAADVLRDADAVAAAVVASAQAARPLHHREGNSPPSPTGEDFRSTSWNT